MKSAEFRFLTVIKDEKGKKKLEWEDFFKGKLEYRFSDKKFYRGEFKGNPPKYMSHHIVFNRQNYQSVVNDLSKFFEDYDIAIKKARKQIQTNGPTPSKPR